MKTSFVPSFARRHPRGLTLVAVLWIVMLLTVLITTLARSVRLENRVCLASCERLRGSWACRAGLETALALLNDDGRAGDGLSDLWSDNPADCNDVPLSGCRFSIEIIDEASKLNVNDATREQLLALPDMPRDIADAILDWRDRDEQANSRGVEGGYYGNLRPGYEIRNAPLQTIRELLLVKDVSPELLYGEDTNQNRRLDDNELDGDDRPPHDDRDSELDPGWIDYLTCSSYALNRDADGQKRININTADETTLQNSLGIRESYAKWIVENRDYESIADLIDENSPRETPPDDDSSDPRPIDLPTFQRIADRITITDEERLPGRVNVNTASHVVLAALPKMDEKTAQSIVQYRDTRQQAMESIADLLDARRISIETFKDLANHITTRSDVFTVYVTSRSDQTAAAWRLEAVVDRHANPPTISWWHEGTSH